MNYFSTIIEMSVTPKRTLKEKILKDALVDDTFRQLVKFAYDPFITFNIKDVQMPEVFHGKDDIFWAVEYIISDILPVRGNELRARVQYLLSTLCQEDAEVIRRVLNKDFECGINTKSIVKVCPGLVPTFDFMLAGSDRTAIKYPAFSQLKADGTRTYLNVTPDGKAVFTSRKGRKIDLLGVFDSTIQGVIEPGTTIDGELVVLTEDYTKRMPRKAGNGIINKAIKGTITEEEARRVMFVVWDMVDYTSTIPYQERFRCTKKVVRDVGNPRKFVLIPSKIVNSQSEAEEHFEQMLAAGEEGIVLKNMNHVWKAVRSKDHCKMKAEKEADLRVVGFQEGTGKNEGKLGALVVESQDKILCTNVGTGFSDEERGLPKDYWMGKIITVTYNEKIQNENGGWKLFLPRFTEKRFDKEIANTFEEIE